MDLTSMIRHWRLSQRKVRMLDALSPNERDALARDIGVSEGVLANLALCKPNAGAELPRLMRALSLDAEQIVRKQAALLRDMSVTCSQCNSAARCRRDLDQGRAETAYAGYCPNAESLQELQAETGQRKH